MLFNSLLFWLILFLIILLLFNLSSGEQLKIKQRHQTDIEIDRFGKDGRLDMVCIFEELAANFIFSLFLVGVVLLLLPVLFGFVGIKYVSKSSEENKLFDQVVLHVVIDVHNVSPDLAHLAALGGELHPVVVFNHAVAVHPHGVLLVVPNFAEELNLWLDDQLELDLPYPLDVDDSFHKHLGFSLLLLDHV